MKKIIATVLAMVMALALCTTAFAAVTKVNAVAATKTTLGWDNYYVENDVVVDKYGTPLSDAMQDIYAHGGFYKITLTKVESAVDATCAKAGYIVDAFVGNDNNYYVKSADVDAADEDFGNNTVYIGTSFSDAVKYVKFASKDALDTCNKVPAGHYLYETTDVFGANKATVYKCADCGGTFVLVGTVATVDNVKTLDKVVYTVPADVSTVLAKAGVDPTDAAAAGTYYVLTEGNDKAADTTTTTTSPKTFDAGIAMYVGMALTSVAGSAVVIGKKKEF